MASRHRVAISDGSISAKVQFLVLRAAAALGGVNYRGLRRACRLLAPFFPRSNSVVIEQDARRLKIYLSDPYWIRYAFSGFSYEEEVASVLEDVLDDQSVFIDCGANTGYWSVYAAAKVRSRGRVVAVEPADPTFMRLSENMELNGGFFAAVKKAVFSRSGVTLRFHVDPVRHDSNACAVDTADRARRREIAVQSITVDDIFDSISSQDDGISNVVVKLDVEGAEQDALLGARKLIERGALFIYEDHGNDPHCRNTHFVLNTLGLDVYFLQSGMRPVRIENISCLAPLKTCSTRGYNLVAAKRDSPVLTLLLAGPGLLVRKEIWR